VDVIGSIIHHELEKEIPNYKLVSKLFKISQIAMSKLSGKHLIPFDENEEIIKGYIELRRMILLDVFDQDLFKEVIKVVEV